MRLLRLFLPALLATPVAAAIRGAPAGGPAARAGGAAPAFVPRYLGSLSLSLESRPFFAGRLLSSFDKHLSAVAPLRSAGAVAAYLEAQVKSDERRSFPAAALADALGQEPIDPDPAAALLLANGLMRPEQFREALEGMEGLKPEWGRRIALELKNAGDKGFRAPEFKRLLEELGARFMPEPRNPVYDRRGRLVGAYDGGR